MSTLGLFENLAASTWHRIRLGASYRISQGEETITDFNLLEIARFGSTEVQVFKTSKSEESSQGTDWEWWLGYKSHWLRFAVQAKRITSRKNPTTKRLREHYESLGHKVKGKSQIEILEEYARANKAIPLYCFYNYVDEKTLKKKVAKFGKEPKAWKCGYDYDPQQFGCTLTPLANVKDTLSKHGCRNFSYIHEEYQQTKPWRCLFGCPLIRKAYKGDSEIIKRHFGFEEYTIYKTEELPEELIESNNSSNSDRPDEAKELRIDFFRNHSSLYISNNDTSEIAYPERILVIRLTESVGFSRVNCTLE